MKKVVKVLDDLQNVNSYMVAEQVTLMRGNTQKFYFQLFSEQQSLDPLCENTNIRYIPQGTNITVEATFEHIDDEFVIKRVAAAPFAGDQSIWCIDILAQDEIMFNSLQVTVHQDGVPCYFLLETDITTIDVGPTSDRTRFC